MAPKLHTWLSTACYAPWGSLFARKFSLLWRLANSVRKQLNCLAKAEVPWHFQARNRRISLYLPLEQGNKRTETGSPMTAACELDADSSGGQPSLPDRMLRFVAH